MKRYFIVLLTALALQAQSWYQIATPTNSLTCVPTNIVGTVQSYNVRWGPNLTDSRLIKNVQMPYAFTNFLSGYPYGIVSIQVSVNVLQTNGIVETPPSTNLSVWWIPPPAVPGGATGVTVK